jgi:hypothetical protein
MSIEWAFLTYGLCILTFAVGYFTRQAFEREKLIQWTCAVSQIRMDAPGPWKFSEEAEAAGCTLCQGVHLLPEDHCRNCGRVGVELPPGGTG